MGHIIAHMGDELTSVLNKCLPKFKDRLQNEITRLTAVKALTKIAQSPLKVNLISILVDCFPILASFLRKNQRVLKLSTLSLLDVLVRNYHAGISEREINIVIVELPRQDH